MTIPILVLASLLLVVGFITAIRWSRMFTGKGSGSRETNQLIEMQCSVCMRTLIISPQALEPLSPPEKALVVSAMPSVVRRPLADYTCPYCDASHCFAVDNWRPKYVGTNLYQAQESQAHCLECHRPLRRLPGASGGLTEEIQDTSNLLPDTGLKCPRCHAICCVSCCRDTSKRRATGGVLLCPRCAGRPVNLLYYP